VNTAVVTGASRGIGRSIVLYLLEKGYKVTGISRNMTECDINHENLQKIDIDLSDKKDTEKKIILIDKNTDILVNNVGKGFYGDFDQMGMKEIEEIISLNFTVHVKFINYFIKGLIKNKGHIINISSFSSRVPAPKAALYSALKTSLNKFSENIFEEYRKSGVKISTIIPDTVKTDFYDNTFLDYSENREAYITKEDIVKVFDFILSQSEGTIIPEIIIRPQKHEFIKRGKK